ncbi:hypothetical protein JCM10207_007772 [Rhodosporidiobolus poonsookiae]
MPVPLPLPRRPSPLVLSSPHSPDADDEPSLASLVRQHVDALLAAQQGTVMTSASDDGTGQQQPWPEWPTFPPEGGDAGSGDGTTPVPIPGDGDSGGDPTLFILLPLLLLLTLLLFLIILLTLLLLKRKRLGGIALPTSESEVGGPVNLADEQGLFRQAEGGFEGVEARWLEEQDEQTRRAYQRAKAWQLSSPPASQPSEITLSQFLSIQEKGVSAWSFEPDYESSLASPVVVVQRTEITFLDATAADEPCSVMSNLPIPKLNETYYWECKMFELPPGTTVSVGLATKPYPGFCLPGHSPHSVAYHSADGFLSASYPFLSRSYGPALSPGDTLGVGYRPRAGSVFFTRNGRSLGDAFVGFNRFNVFPTLGATGPATVHVNLGQAGFVFIEANVKKWGLAPMMGTLAPPPAYGSERGSILLEAGRAGANQAEGSSSAASAANPHSHHLATASTSQRQQAARHHRRTSSTLSNASAVLAAAALNPSSSSSSSQPIRPSPLRHGHSTTSSSSHAHSRQTSTASSATVTPPPGQSSAAAGVAEEEGEEDEDDEPHNPPTPGLLDISLHSMHRFPERLDDGDSDDEGAEGEGEAEEEEEEDDGEAEGPRREEAGAGRGTSPPPPEYAPIDPHMYAPGVAEALLEDALSAYSTTSQSPSSASPSSRAAAGGAAAPLNPAQAALLQRFVAERAAARSPGSASGRGYEGRTGGGRGGAGNVVAGGGTQGGFWGWLSGRPTDGEGEAQAQPAQASR